MMNFFFEAEDNMNVLHGGSLDDHIYVECKVKVPVGASEDYGYLTMKSAILDALTDEEKAAVSFWFDGQEQLLAEDASAGTVAVLDVDRYGDDDDDDDGDEAEYTLTKDDATTVTRYNVGDGFYVLVSETPTVYDVWLSHDEYCVMDYMFGLPKNQPFEYDPLTVITNNLPEYIAQFRKDHMD